ncbi:MAG: Sjogren's syndrome/scleroderma autoantigen 1 family protein [Halorhabdus sp.]
MSDFDEEAERERLREQYEREQEKREATEHMSELLLKGATMTDSHCEECGDPIFRYDGQTFCPTCQREVDLEAGSGGVAAEDTQDDSTSKGAVGNTVSEDETPTDEEDTATAEPDEASATVGSAVDPSPNETAAASTDTHEKPKPAPDRDGSDQSTAAERVSVPTAAPTGERKTGNQPRENANSLTEARTALEATLLTFARKAETTDDPRQASDALKAAREAAETLAALDDVR